MYIIKTSKQNNARYPLTFFHPYFLRYLTLLGGWYLLPDAEISDSSVGVNSIKQVSVESSILS